MPSHMSVVLTISNFSILSLLYFPVRNSFCMYGGGRRQQMLMPEFVRRALCAVAAGWGEAVPGRLHALVRLW